MPPYLSPLATLPLNTMGLELKALHYRYITVTLPLQVDTMGLELKAVKKEKNAAKIAQLEKRIDKAKEDMEIKARPACHTRHLGATSVQPRCHLGAISV